MRPMVGCTACCDGLAASAEHVALLAASVLRRDPGNELCGRHVRELLQEIPALVRRDALASLLGAAAVHVARGRRMRSCPICSAQEAAERQARSGPLCLHHLRRVAADLAWDALRRDATRLADALGRWSRHGLAAALWGSDAPVDGDDCQDVCPVCGARAAARAGFFRWLAEALDRYRSQALGTATALCAAHAWRFGSWSPAAGQILVGLSVDAWTCRLRWLVSRLDHRPPERLRARVAALPGVLQSLADDAGRLPLGVACRATAAVLLRTPATELAYLTARALRSEPCPACAAEDRSARETAFSCDVAVCASDVALVLAVNPDGAARRAVQRATVSGLEREARNSRLDRAGSTDRALRLLAGS